MHQMASYNPDVNTRKPSTCFLAQQLPSHLRGGGRGGVCIRPKNRKMLTSPLHPSLLREGVVSGRRTHLLFPYYDSILGLPAFLSPLTSHHSPLKLKQASLRWLNSASQRGILSEPFHVSFVCIRVYSCSAAGK